MPILALLKQDQEMWDAKTPGLKSIITPAGVYPLERIDNPAGFKEPWLVLEGTKIGMAEPAWRQWDDEISEILES